MSDYGPGYNSGHNVPVTAGKDSDPTHVAEQAIREALHDDYYRDDFGQFASKPDPIGLSLSTGLLPVVEHNPPEPTMPESDVIEFTDTEANAAMKFFRFAADSIVNASALSKQFKEIEVQLKAMKDDITVYRNTIASQDRELAALRAERVDLQRENAEVRAENASQAAEIVKLTEQVRASNESRDKYQSDYINQCHESERLLRERDEALTKQLELEHQLTLARAAKDNFEREASEARATLERVRASLNKPQLVTAA